MKRLPPKAERRAFLSLTLAELVERTGDSPHLLAFVLAQEVAAGRVLVTAEGGYALVARAFPPGTVAGLRWLSGARPIEDDERGPTTIGRGRSDSAVAELVGVEAL